MININEIARKHGIIDGLSIYSSSDAITKSFNEYSIDLVEKVLELAAENANLLIRKENMYKSSDNEILFDNEYSHGEYDSNGPDYHIDVMINKDSILDVINQVKLNSNERD